MKTFNAPSVEVLKFAVEDIIATSATNTPGEDELPEVRD